MDEYLTNSCEAYDEIDALAGGRCSELASSNSFLPKDEDGASQYGNSDHQDEPFDDEDFYNIDHPRRGLCIVFADMIAGYEDHVRNDISKIRRAFQGLSFEVNVHLNLSVPEQEEWLTRSATKKSNVQSDCIACWFLTFNSALPDQQNERLELCKISRLFCSDAAPFLAGKPKLFFIQTLQHEGLRVDVTEHSSRSIPQFPDFLYCFFTQAATPNEDGTSAQTFPYVEILCDVLERCTTPLPLIDVLYLLDIAMAEISDMSCREAGNQEAMTSRKEQGANLVVPFYMSTLTKKLLLNKCSM
ncbi:caspase-3-like [Ornithodoros turicata]|uniref:caspase-3-like n=1 Tax=Ornithodoros turicata TaxID=34597 RepID=UPI00313A2429